MKANANIPGTPLIVFSKPVLSPPIEEQKMIFMIINR